MEAVARPRVKICCISSAEEASLAVRYGASALGLVSAMPSGPGVIPDNLIAEIAATVPLDEARLVATQVSAILLDSGNQSLTVKELGGTGRVHDWTVSRAIRAAIDIPLYLAGGLNASNVAEAVHAVGPFALDICSGVRTDGWLDEEKLGAFMRAAGVLSQDAQV